LFKILIMKINRLKNKKILLLGFGREGLSSYKFLRRYVKNGLIGVADEKRLADFEKQYQTVLTQDKKLSLHLGKNYLDSLEDYEVIIKTPGIKLDKKIAKAYGDTSKLTSNLNIFLANISGKVIGVTGSKGKSTSASLIYHIFRKAGRKVVLIGNIGRPALDYLNWDSKHTIFVVEMSSYQLDTLNQKKIDSALITAFFPEHLDYHGNSHKYFQAKMNIVRNLKKNGVMVYNRKYKKIKRFIDNQRVKNIGYLYNSIGAYCHTPLLGKHNRENIFGCIEIAKLFEVREAIINRTIKNFRGLPHRLENVGKFKGIRFYNDVLSTTPESTIEAIDALKGKSLETIILGGFDRGLDYKKLARKIVSSKVKNVILWPHSGIKIYKEIRKLENSEIRLVQVKNMRETVRACYKYTAKDGVALLSPASSSYDFYKNFEEKGKEFNRLAMALGR